MTDSPLNPVQKTYEDSRGLTITYYVWNAERESGVVQIAHGHGEHARRYDELAGLLNEAGYTVYADDHRGHGRTGLDQWQGQFSKLGQLGPRGLQSTIDAVAQLSSIIRIGHPAQPLVLVAHSWGSMLGQMILNQRKAAYNAVVFSGTVYRMPGAMGTGNLNRNHHHPGGTGFEWLSRDPQVVQAAAADPFMPLITPLQAYGLRDALAQFGRPARALDPFPLLIMVGSDDTFGGATSARKLAHAYRRRSGLHDVTLKTYPGARHEIFNEINRAEIFEDLINWINTAAKKIA